MEKISFKNYSSFGLSPLSTATLKEITGRFSSDGGCKNSQGGCDIGANCSRGGAPDKCSTASGACKCGN